MITIQIMSNYQKIKHKSVNKLLKTTKFYYNNNKYKINNNNSNNKYKCKNRKMLNNKNKVLKN